MPNKRRDLSVGTSVRDALVDTSCEVGDAVLEIMVCDLHDVYVMKLKREEKGMHIN